MFTANQMKKANLKARKQREPSSSKQMTIDKFFVAKNFPNKENLEDGSPLTNASRTAFLCQADVEREESPKNSSSTPANKSVDSNRKVLKANSETCNSPNYSTPNKRKSSESLDAKENTEGESLVDSSPKLENETTHPRRKKVNLNNSAEKSIGSKKKHCATVPKRQSVKTPPKTPQAKRIAADDVCDFRVSKKSQVPLKDPPENAYLNEKCVNKSVSTIKLKSNAESVRHITSDISEEPNVKNLEENPSVRKKQATSLKSVSSKLDLNQSSGTIAPSSPKKSTVNNKVNDTVSDQDAILASHFNDDLFAEDWNLSGQEIYRDLTLNSLKRCKITDVKIVNHDKLVTLQSLEDESASAVCKLRGAWFHTIVELGDIVNIVAELRNNEWVVDNSGGLIILNPDTLISSTSLMGSMFCRRKAVLSSSFQVMDTGAKAMVIGCLVHSLLQKVMQNNIRCEKKIQEIIEDLVVDPSFVHSLLLLPMDFEEVKEELSSFVPEILKFMEAYVTPTSGDRSSDNWNGEITCIKDIEENIWSPTYGMKGKVDVTVEVSVGGVKKMMPFELKTGKSSNSAEHRGQVILYVLMMAELNYDVNSGLLVYLKDGQIKEVPVDHHVKRDIMMLRNDFVHYITSNQTARFLEDGSIAGPYLPEPIDHHSACKRCPYQTFCCAALVDDNMSGVHPKNLLTDLSATTLNHLKLPHIRYVFHWIGLLKLEEADRKSRSNSHLKDLWSLSAEKRAECGACIANLSLVKVDLKNNSFVHVFKFSNQNSSSNFSAGDCVIVSSDTHIAVAMGLITYITEDSISMSLEKDLQKRDDKVFHIDRYESQSLFNFNVSNLGLLLEDSVPSNKLREDIIDLKSPSFSKIRPKLPDDIVKKLNDGQKQAVLKALAAESYILIQGMPGCGKTETLAALVRLFVENGQSVLITSHTHSAVDTLVLRLCDSVDVLRLGSKNKIHPSVHKYSDEVQLAKLELKSLVDIKRFYLSKMVVAVTVLGSSHSVLSLRKFDVCIVDEATQILQPSVLRPLMAASKFILVGDPLQLPPLVHSGLARSSGLSESLFVRLSRPSATVMLNTQYRMNKQITALANFFMYNGALKCANETVANNTLHFNIDDVATETLSCFPWLKLALSCQIEHSVVFVDVKESGSVVENENCINHAEAKALMVVIEALTNGGVKPNSIGVIAPYRAQVNLLRQLTVENKFNVEVNTIDQYQGKDKEIILFSCTVSVSGKEGILNSSQRLSVAITRAKQKLVFFGDTTILRSYKLFEKILHYMSVDCVTRA